jgi:hypothetical protein
VIFRYVDIAKLRQQSVAISHAGAQFWPPASSWGVPAAGSTYDHRRRRINSAPPLAGREEVREAVARSLGQLGSIGRADEDPRTVRTGQDTIAAPTFAARIGDGTQP